MKWLLSRNICTLAKDVEVHLDSNRVVCIVTVRVQDITIAVSGFYINWTFAMLTHNWLVICLPHIPRCAIVFPFVDRQFGHEGVTLFAETNRLSFYHIFCIIHEPSFFVVK